MTDARKYLESFRIQESRIQLKTEQVQSLQERLTSITAPMDKEQVSHTKNVGIMADTVAMIVDIQREIDQQTADLYRRKREAYQLLDQLHPAHERLLLDRYLEGKTLDELRGRLFVSKRQLLRRSKEAIAELQKVIDRNDVTGMSPDDTTKTADGGIWPQQTT